MVRYVPVQFIQDCIMNGRMKELRFFLFLKDYSKEGVLYRFNQHKTFVANDLKLSERTISRLLRKLFLLKWIGVNKKGDLFIRGWNRLEILVECKFKSRVEFNRGYLHKDIYTGYFMGAVISYQCKLKNYELWKGSKNGGSIPFHNPQHPISVSFLSNLLKLPQSTIINHKKKAIKYEFVKRYRNISVIPNNSEQINIKELQKNWCGKSFPLLCDGGLKIINADSFIPLLTFKRYRGQKLLE